MRNPLLERFADRTRKLTHMERRPARNINCPRSLHKVRQIKRRFKRQHVRRSKLHAKATGFTALEDDRYTSFCHESPQLRSCSHSGVSSAEDVDYPWEDLCKGVMGVTHYREAKHDLDTLNWILTS